MPLRQVGGHVSFSLQIPSPLAPVVAQVDLDDQSCSALLHWAPPLEERYLKPISKHYVYVQPVLPATRHVAAGKEIDVWCRDSRDVEKRKSMRITQLQRGRLRCL